MGVTPFDHPFLQGLLGDAELAEAFSATTDLRAMLAFETALARAEADEGLIPASAADAIAAACVDFVPDMAALAAATSRDGVVVPALLAALRSRLEPVHARHLHMGATSQDVIDTSLVLRLGPVLDTLDSRLSRLAAALDALARQASDIRVMGRTRMQDALPIALAHRISEWRSPLAHHCERIAGLRPRLLVVQLGGPVGTRETFGDKAEAVVRRVAVSLGLAAGPCWHSNREPVAELAAVFSLISGSLGKLGADVAIMALLGEIKLRSGGSSSAMAHKSNPVGAEILVSLARFNASLLSAAHHPLVHENERSGAAWTLEWLSLPQMAVAAGASLQIASALLPNLVFAK